jgi:hypothetical protein
VRPFGIHHAISCYHDGPFPGDLVCAHELPALIRSFVSSPASSADAKVRGTLVVDRAPVGFQVRPCHVHLRVAAGTGNKLVEKPLVCSESSCVPLQTLRSGVSVEACFMAAHPKRSIQMSEYTSREKRHDAVRQRCGRKCNTLLVNEAKSEQVLGRRVSNRREA